MQQTEKYQLNLIEKTDPFSPDALNQNTQKVEQALSTALAGEEAARGAADAALAARVTTLEGKKIAIGTYTGNGSAQRTVQLPFAPPILIVQMRGAGNAYIFTQGFSLISTGNVEAGRLDGAALYVPGGAFTHLNNANEQYVFLAFPQ